MRRWTLVTLILLLLAIVVVAVIQVRLGTRTDEPFPGGPLQTATP